MTFVESIKTVAFKKYATFEGKASRSELWWFLLFTQLFQLILQYMYAGLSITAPLSLAFIISSLIFFIPTLTVSVRRLHDIGKSGWWIILPWVLSAATLLIVLILSWLDVSQSLFEIPILAWVLSSLYVVYLFIKPSALKDGNIDNQKIISATARKVWLTILGLVSGPIIILLTASFYNWSLYSAIGAAIVVSYGATSNIWKKL